MSRVIVQRRTARKAHRCMNSYPCGRRTIRPGETYWVLSLPPDTFPFDAKHWVHDAECNDCYESRGGVPVRSFEVMDERS